MRLTRFVGMLGTAAALVLAPAVAQAASFTVDATHDVAPGGSVDFNATLTREAGDSDPLQLLGITINLNPGFTADDSPFFLNWPLALDSSVPGVSDTFTGVLFTLFADASVVPPGPYAGSVTLLLGTDDPQSDFEVTQSFNVTVPDVPPPPVPEPATLALVSLGLAGLATRRKATRSSCASPPGCDTRRHLHG